MAPTIKGTAAHIQAVLFSQPRDCSSSVPIWVPGCGPGFAQREDLQMNRCVRSGRPADHGGARRAQPAQQSAVCAPELVVADCPLRPCHGVLREQRGRECDGVVQCSTCICRQRHAYRRAQRSTTYDVEEPAGNQDFQISLICICCRSSIFHLHKPTHELTISTTIAHLCAAG